MILLPGPLRRATYRGLPAMGRSALATAVMVIVVWPLRTQFAVLPILAGVAVYVGVALLLQVFPLEDRALVASLVARGLARMRRRAVATSPEVAA